jgi:hypothetical protein
MNTIIYEWRYRGDIWRLEWVEHEGRKFANLRRWFWADDILKPTKVGCTLSLDRLKELYDALGAFLKNC